MALYDSILQHEQEETGKVLNKMLEKNPLLKIAYIVMGKDIWMENISSQMFLDEAYRLKGSKISDSHLDNLTIELEDIYDQKFGIVSPFLSAKRDWIKACIGFYQQIIQEDKSSDNFEDAIKRRFKNESAYREARQPIIEAVKKMYDEAKEIRPLISEIIDDSLDATEEIREEEIKRLFPKHFDRIV